MGFEVEAFVILGSQVGDFLGPRNFGTVEVERSFLDVFSYQLLPREGDDVRLRWRWREAPLLTPVGEEVESSLEEVDAVVDG